MKKVILFVVFSFLISQLYCQVPLGSTFMISLTSNGTKINSQSNFIWNCKEDGDSIPIVAGTSTQTNMNLQLTESLHISVIDSSNTINVLSFDINGGPIFNLSKSSNVGFSVSGLKFTDLATCNYYFEISGYDNSFYQSPSASCKQNNQSSTISVSAMFTSRASITGFSVIIIATSSVPANSDALTDSEKVAIASLVPILFFLALTILYFGYIRKIRKEQKVDKVIDLQFVTDKLQTKLNRLESENTKLTKDKKNTEKLVKVKVVSTDVLHPSDSSEDDEENSEEEEGENEVPLKTKK